MSILSAFGLETNWRDFWAMWNALVVPQVVPLEGSDCYLPRLAIMPEVGFMTFPASGKIEYNFHLKAGSIIWGFWAPETSVEFNTVTIQFTDVELGHEFFQEPIETRFLMTKGTIQGWMPSYTMLPTPHPVVGTGLFTLEAWGVPGDTFFMILGVAEVADCLVVPQ
jgi:hypothetical protein